MSVTNCLNRANSRKLINYPLDEKPYDIGDVGDNPFDDYF